MDVHYNYVANYKRNKNIEDIGMAQCRKHAVKSQVMKQGTGSGFQYKVIHTT